MNNLLLLLSFFCGIQLSAQELISGTYDFQSDPNKEYTLYIPSTYEEGTPNDMMLALHPWNTSRWNAESWCDTLKTFAETNNLFLVCPDGGPDGIVDDAIDTAFTTFLIDEVLGQYSISENDIYAIGFSWGGKTVYTYGLQHADRFAGFIPVGAAVNSSEVSPIADAVTDKKFYVVHGSQDSPSVRYTPIINLLDPLHCVESTLLPGIGHTIDFPNRNQILTNALNWIKTNQDCGSTTSTDDGTPEKADFLKYNIIHVDNLLPIKPTFKNVRFSIVSLDGQLVGEGLAAELSLSTAGHYILISNDGISQKFVVK